MSSVPSSDSDSGLSTLDLGVSWTTEDFIEAHMAIKNSGRHNFEGCKIPVPTKIRFDRIEEALEGKLSPKEHRGFVRMGPRRLGPRESGKITL